MTHNTFFVDIGDNWTTIESWHQLTKVAPVLELVRTNEFESIVDLGCGAGDLKKFLQSYDAVPSKFVGVDINSESDADIFADITQDIEGIDNESIDLVTFLDAIENIALDRRVGVYDEINRMLKPGGFLYIFFRTLNFKSTGKYANAHIAGEPFEAIVNSLKNFTVKQRWGINAGAESNNWKDFFPKEINQVFYTLDTPNLCKFNGAILQKKD